MSTYQPSFFDEAESLENQTKLKDLLGAYKQHLGFEIFRPQLELVFNKHRKTATGRKELPELIGPENKNETLFAGRAYKSAKTDEKLTELGITTYVHKIDRRNRPLNDLQKEHNQLKSQVRCHIEHIFGCVENSMSGPELGI